MSHVPHHYRRLTPADMATLDGKNDAQKAASIHAVIVGRPSGDYVLDVLGDEEEALCAEIDAEIAAALEAIDEEPDVDEQGEALEGDALAERLAEKEARKAERLAELTAEREAVCEAARTLSPPVSTERPFAPRTHWMQPARRSAALPGTRLGRSLDKLHHQTYPTVAEAEWEEEIEVPGEDPEGPPVTTTVLRRGKMNHVPGGVTPLATDLNPHHWA